jgi:predicted Rossmann fold nucleotide-binding protein DprA/Smf involved in DNA uptake
VYDAVADDTTAEEIASATSLTHAEVAAALTELELDGHVRSRAGRWRRTA